MFLFELELTAHIPISIDTTFIHCIVALYRNVVDGMEHTALGKSKNGSLLSASYNST